MADIIRNLLEILGTVAFAVSGALVAIGAGLDIFGVVFVGAVTAVGGGILRDLILGSTPPLAFVDPTFCFIAILCSLAVFVIAYFNRKRFGTLRLKIEAINNFFDAIGLAAFTVTGSELAYTGGFSDSLFGVMMLGMITGVGGGMFRDILVDTTPYVLKKRIYAIASLIGSLLYYVLTVWWHRQALSLVAAMVAVVTIRLLATWFHWDLPHIDPSSTEEDAA